jgi:hypothetical protein
MFPVARHYGTVSLRTKLSNMAGFPYLEEAERPEGETGMSEVPHLCGASLPVSVEQISGTRLRVMVGNGVRSARVISFLRFEKNSQGTVKAISRIGH